MAKLWLLMSSVGPSINIWVLNAYSNQKLINKLVIYKDVELNLIDVCEVSTILNNFAMVIYLNLMVIDGKPNIYPKHFH